MDSIVNKLYAENKSLRAENKSLRAENKSLRAENKSLRAENDQLKVRINKLEDLVTSLVERINELEHQLKLNSKNSSKPPSSDFPKTKSSKQKKERGRKPGGQPGHKGSHRPLVDAEKVDKTENHIPSNCKDCGELLEGEDANPQRHQVTELPSLSCLTFEHRLHALTCRCGTTTRAELPVGVSLSAFGPRLTSLVGVLSGTYRLSKRQIEQILSDCYGISISLGSVKALETSVSRALASSVEEAKRQIKLEPSVNIDETGWRHLNKRAWLWTVTTRFLSVFEIDKSRGSQVVKRLIGPGYKGIVGSDRWSAYSWINSRRRQLCWAHLKRDFKKIADRKSSSAWIGEALELQRKELFNYWQRVRDGTLQRSSFRSYVSKIRGAIKGLLVEGSKCDHKKIASLCRGILKTEGSMWTFVRVKAIEATNNSAERAIRPAVIWRKVSYGTQSEAGRVFVSRMLTVSASLRLQGRNVLEFVTEAFKASLNNQLMSPSLLHEC